jgi:hypothetical protein
MQQYTRNWGHSRHAVQLLSGPCPRRRRAIGTVAWGSRPNRQDAGRPPQEAGEGRWRQIGRRPSEPRRGRRRTSNSSPTRRRSEAAVELHEVEPNWQGPRRYSESSTRRPASVIMMRRTSLRPPPTVTVSGCALASPSLIRLASVARSKPPWASKVGSVRPCGASARIPSAPRRSGPSRGLCIIVFVPCDLRYVPPNNMSDRVAELALPPTAGPILLRAADARLTLR